MGWDPRKLDEKVWRYYLKRRDGSILERPYESWGPDEVERDVRLKISVGFEKVKWDRCYTGRGVLRASEEEGGASEEEGDYYSWSDDIGPTDKIVDSRRGWIVLDFRKLRKEESSIAVEEDTRPSKKRKLSGSEGLRRIPVWARQKASSVRNQVRPTKKDRSKKRSPPSSLEMEA